MDLMGVRLFVTFLASLGAPLLLLLLLSIRFYRKEGNPWSWNHFCERFRLRPMGVKEWAWTIPLAVFLFASNVGLSFTYEWISGLIPVPKFLVRMMDDDPNYFMELAVKGNWLIPLGFLGFLVCNVVGEEFWWRGYIFPRQEVAHQKWTWLIHGLMWNAFHLFMPWEAIRLLPGALALSFVAQRLRNTMPGLIAHFAVSIPALAQIIGKVM